jgi:hypothetical protein
MGCAVFTLLGAYILHSNKSGEWAQRTTFGLAVFFVLIACFLAWRDENRNAEDLQKRYFDERPRLMLGLISHASDEEWRKMADSRNTPVHFYLQHLSGRPATEIRFDPILSEGRKFDLRFTPIVSVVGPVRSHVDYEVWENGIKPDQKIIESIGWGCMLRLFFYECDWDTRMHPYELTVRYRDRFDERLQRFRFEFDAKEYKVLPPTEITSQ